MAAALNSPRILITGGRSCLAGVVSRHFSARGSAVQTFSRTGGEGHQPLAALLEAGRPEPVRRTLMHLAWSTVPYNAEQLPGYDGAGDLALLDDILHRVAAAPDHARVHFVFFSSGGAIYGNARNGQPCREGDPCTPLGRYGRAKLAAEQMIQDLGRSLGFAWTILRISNPYGFSLPTSRPQGIIPVALKCAREGRTLTIWGDGTARKDFLHHSDFSAALEQVVRLRPAGIFNVCHGESHTIREVLDLIGQAVGGHIKTVQVPAHAWDVHDSLLDNTAFRAATGWQPAVGLAEGIRRAAVELRIP